MERSLEALSMPLSFLLWALLTSWERQELLLLRSDEKRESSSGTHPASFGLRPDNNVSEACFGANGTLSSSTVSLESITFWLNSLFCRTAPRTD